MKQRLIPSLLIVAGARALDSTAGVHRNGTNPAIDPLRAAPDHMKTHYVHAAVVLLCASFLPAARAATLSQTFEPGETTPAWGANWTNGATGPGFLNPSLGGTASGTGTSGTQSFSRNFRNNTAGIDPAGPYSISMYVQVSAFGTPSNGLFEIFDGQYGSENTANLRILTEETSPGSYTYHWQAYDGGNDWTSLGIDLVLSGAYAINFIIDPAAGSYSASVSHVDGNGGVISTAGLSGLGFHSPDVVGNLNNANLGFYVQASAGTTLAYVDNINIAQVPEPSSILSASGAVFLTTLRRRRRAVSPREGGKSIPSGLAAHPG